MDRKLPKGVIVRGSSIQVGFSYQSRRYRETLRMEPNAANIKAAARLLEAVKHDIAMGKFDYLDHFPHSKHAMRLSAKAGHLITVDTLLNDWLKRVANRAAYSTLKDYSSAVRYHLIPRFGSIRVAELKTSQIEDWLAELSISGKRKNNILIPLRQAFEDALFEGLIDRNPMDRVRSAKQVRSEPEPFSKAEAQRIIEALDGVERNFYQFAFYSGLRTSELIALTWENVDIDRNVVHVRSACVRGVIKETKTTSGWRSVELLPLAKQSLIDQQALRLNSDGFVFFDPKSLCRWKDDQVVRKRVWKKAVSKAGIKYRNPYQTRHSYASWLLSAGENPLKVAQQMGHSDWGMIRKIYGRWVV